MGAFRQAFQQGLRGALRNPRMLLPLYLCGLLLGLLQTWPLVAALADGAASNPFLGNLASGGIDTLVDLFLASPTAAGGTILWALVALPLAALFSLAYNFFSGGIVSVYAGTRPFWAGCRRTFWSFSGLGALLVALLLLLLGAANLLCDALRADGQVRLIIAVLLLVLLNTLGEYARVIAVARDRRNPFALIALALGFYARNFGGVLALLLAGLLLQLALTVLYAPIAGALAGTPVLIVWQQLAVLAWLWIKLLRLAWALGYVRAAGLSVEREPILFK